MFDGLLSWLGGFATALWTFLKELWRQCGVTLVNAWTIMLTVVAWVMWAWTKIGEVLATLVNTIDQVVFPTVGTPSIAGPIMSKLEVVNAFVPVTETFAFAVAFFAFVCALAIYRLIKSWIPTLS